MSILPHDPAQRKNIPVYAGVLRYFPAALIKVAERSRKGNDDHNPGQPLHWARDKSSDHLDALTRHLLEGDLEGVAWRALAALQVECEANGAPIAPGAVVNSPAAEILRARSEIDDGDFGLTAGQAHEHDHAAYVAATASLPGEGS